ncbi:unnamed protein product, partial [Durusdinium trenchii]
RDGDKSTKDEDGDDNGPKTEKKEEEDEDDDPSSNEENPVEDAEVRDENTEGNRILCATAVLDTACEDLSSRIANEVYHACRSGSLSLSGFPNYEPVLTALKSVNNQQIERAYKVCAQAPSGLAILQCYSQRWIDDELTSEKALDIIKVHNEKFNPNEPADFVQADTSSRTDYGCVSECSRQTAPTHTFTWQTQLASRTDEAQESPNKKIKIEEQDTCKEETVTSLVNPRHA